MGRVPQMLRKLFVATYSSVFFEVLLNSRCFNCKPAVCGVKSRSTTVIARAPPFSLYDARLIRQTYTSSVVLDLVLEYSLAGVPSRNTTLKAMTLETRAILGQFCNRRESLLIANLEKLKRTSSCVWQRDCVVVSPPRVVPAGCV